MPPCWNPIRRRFRSYENEQYSILLIAARHIFCNVPRQVSLAGAAGGSNASGVKALGLLFSQQVLCLSGGMSKWCSSKLPTGQRLTGRVCSAICITRFQLYLGFLQIWGLHKDSDTQPKSDLQSRLSAFSQGQCLSDSNNPNQTHDHPTCVQTR